MKLQNEMRIEMVMLERHGVSDYVENDGCEYLAGFWNGKRYAVQITEDGQIEELREFEGNWEELEIYILEEEYRKDIACKFNGTYFKYDGEIK